MAAYYLPPSIGTGGILCLVQLYCATFDQCNQGHTESIGKLAMILAGMSCVFA